MTRIFLLRHGETAIMRTHLAGRTPRVPLNHYGRLQAAALAKRLNNLDAIVTSPVQRAVETATIIGRIHGLIPTLSNEFSEFDFGAWTGMTFADLRDVPAWQDFNHSREITAPPGGEAMADVQQRALAGLLPLIQEKYDGQTVAIVSHGDVIRALLIHAAKTGIDQYWRFTVDAASITELACHPDGIERIVRMNDCAHLEALDRDNL